MEQIILFERGRIRIGSVEDLKVHLSCYCYKCLIFYADVLSSSNAYLNQLNISDFHDKIQKPKSKYIILN